MCFIKYEETEREKSSCGEDREWETTWYVKRSPAYMWWQEVGRIQGLNVGKYPIISLLVDVIRDPFATGNTLLYVWWFECFKIDGQLCNIRKPVFKTWFRFWSKRFVISRIYWIYILSCNKHRVLSDAVNQYQIWADVCVRTNCGHLSGDKLAGHRPNSGTAKA